MKYWARWITMGYLLGCATLAQAQAQPFCSTSVPASTPTADFVVDSVNGTATHSKTGLMWKQCAQGQSGAACATGSATAMNWSAALKAAVADRTAGYSDWRLPNLKELRSIVEEECYNPSINASVFPNTPASYFWSASAAAYGSNGAWYVFFGDGNASSSDKGGTNQVRLVRAGQSFGAFDSLNPGGSVTQTVSPISLLPATLAVGGTTTASATASSGLPVTFGSASTSVCTVTRNVVTGVVAGLCDLRANQYGNATYAPAPEVTLLFSVTAAVTTPSTPTILLITSGPGRLTLTLQPPSNTGGAAIVSYSATCSASSHPNATATSTTTTVIVPNLAPGVSYACTATASNGSYTSAATVATVAIPKPKADMTPILMLLLD